jgi:hypothetical protein
VAKREGRGESEVFECMESSSAKIGEEAVEDTERAAYVGVVDVVEVVNEVVR